MRRSRSSRSGATLLVALVALGAALTPATARAEAPPLPDRPLGDSRIFVRVAAGYGRGELFLLDPSSRPLRELSLVADLGVRMARHVAATGGLAIQAGRADGGVSTLRVAPGATVEGAIGPLVLGAGPHASWFGFFRKGGSSAGEPYDVSSIVSRLGAGVHATSMLEVPVTRRFALHAGARADVDAYVALSSTTRYFGSAFAFVGGTFGAL